MSLVPSATEILCAIGGRELLVGRSHECDFPPGLACVPVVTGQRMHTTDPAEIDRQVRDQLAGGCSLYTLDEHRLGRLAPDVILTQNMCSVCSIDLPTVQRIAAGLKPSPRIVTLDPHSVEDVLDDVLKIGEAAGLELQASGLAVDLRERLFRAGEFINPFDDGPAVALLEWTDPLFIAGHWTPQLIERAGARHPLNPTTPRPGSGAASGPQQAQRLAGKSITVPPEILVASDPDILIICPCGVDLPGARSMVAGLHAKPWFASLRAVRTGRLAVVDGTQTFSRPGPRLVDAFEWLVGWINDRPDLIPAGFPWEMAIPGR
ncbi:MAG: ABC transporter substrate-binding protein [Phycisphaerales bacterium]|nr:ABC transporter substrate-binding protein [Phycisphaerales bacterium]